MTTPVLSNAITTSTSPFDTDLNSHTFHKGEAILQKHMGVRQWTEEHMSAIIRPAMPEQHQLFFNQLPYMLMTTIDLDGRPWQSMLTGPVGFVQIVDPETLLFRVKPVKGDPVVDNLVRWREFVATNGGKEEDDPAGLGEGRHCGFLGIEFHTRRRNRINGVIVSLDIRRDGSNTQVKSVNEIGINDAVVLTFTVSVVQSFGNCPKYIQARRVKSRNSEAWNGEVTNLGLTANQQQPSTVVESTVTLTKDMAAIIEKADTLFIASRHLDSDGNEPDTANGLDSSHRGGLPGFVKIINGGRGVVWPDYKGNNMFMTLGNIIKDPRSGLLFPSFDTNDMLYATGKSQILIDDEASLHFENCTRAVLFEFDSLRLVKNSLPFNFEFMNNSPYNPPLPGPPSSSSKDQLTATLVESLPHTWDVATFVFRVNKDVSYIPGQHVTLDFGKVDMVVKTYKNYLKEYGDHAQKDDDLVRTWTVTSCPDLDKDGNWSPTRLFTITVKRKPGGFMSNVLHSIPPGTTLTIPLRGFNGEFTPHHTETNPSTDASPTKLLFIGGGIGITPFLGAVEGMRKRHERMKLASSTSFTPLFDIVVILNASTIDDVPFDLVKKLRGSGVRVVVGTSRKDNDNEYDDDDDMDRTVDTVGRFSSKMVQEFVSDFKERKVYLCGPVPYMLAVEAALQDAGYDNSKILTESFAY
ncbi:hypothetical protein HDU76_003452 [Blyttiomyces sp. JEL0837]|nr:hypothetical protein HDU76_003452 [Blyttiomyces sp. JEL0837]